MWIQFMIKLCGYCIFFRSTKLNAGPPKVNSLIDQLSTNAPSTISKTGLYIVLVMDSYITMSDCQLTMWADDMYSFKLHWPLACRIYFRKYKITFAFSIIFQHWDHTCSWNHDNDQLKLHIVQCVLGSIKLYLHFVSFFNAEITQLVEIIPCGRPRPA